MKKLETVNCEELMVESLKPIEFVVDTLITQEEFVWNCCRVTVVTVKNLLLKIYRLTVTRG